MNAPRVLALVGDISGCTLWRVFQPFAELQRHGVFAHWKARDDPENSDVRFIANVAHNFDVILLPRLFWPERRDAEHFIRGMHRAGLACIVEVDDDVYSPAIVERSYKTQDLEREKGFVRLEHERLARIDVLGLCDGVTVTSRRLATIVSSHTDAPVEVVPNAIDTRWFHQVLRGCRRAVPPLTIGWAGGSRYWEDLEPVAAAWHNLANRYPELTFVVQGFMAEVLIDAVPAERCRRLPWLPLEEYPRALLNFDIGCAAVAPKLFNTAKCVTGDTLVTTATGLQPIAELSQQRVLDTIVPMNTRVWTAGESGWVTASGFYYGGEQDVIRVTTEAGFTIAGTPDHPVRRADLSWALLGELQEGDLLHIVPVQLPDCERAIPFNPWAIRQRRDADVEAEGLPRIRIDAHWGAILGYLIGDGNIQKNAVRITCDKQDADVIEDVVAQFRAIGIQPTLKNYYERRRGYGGQDVCVSSARLNDFLWSLGVEREKRKFLGVPRVILMSPAPVVRAFLRALFESDGTVSPERSSVSFTSMSARLAGEVLLLLTAFGIRASVGRSWNARYQRHYHRIVLSRAAADVFAEHIGFVGARKQARLAELTNRPHSNAYRSQRWEDAVATIERSRGEVFDIEVPDIHEFVGNGFACHNTPIKVWEYAMAGVPCVASPTLYGQVINDGEDGLLAETPAEWEAQLARLIDSRELRGSLWRNQRRRVAQHHSLEHNWHRWPIAWSRILDHFRATQSPLLLPATA